MINKFYNPSKIKTGNNINMIIKKVLSDKINLEEIELPISKNSIIKIYKNSENNKFVLEKIILELTKKNVIAENFIKNNLYKSATQENVDPAIIIEFARIFGFEIDFQRDIRKNDRFQILYEKYYDEDGNYIKSGSILFAFMSLSGKEIALYKFGDDKNYGYFNFIGKSVERALMKTPINGARLSSSFGMRKHPILGYNKMHRGTDFAAKKGTPVMASGTGVIKVAKWNGGYGNYIKIRHNSSYSTAYAHLYRFHRSIKVGKKVRQGDIIGYVGSTGRSTGPHLHYEVIFKGKKINSQKLKLPSGKVLKGEERKLFELHRIKTDVLISEIISNTN